MRQFRFSVRFLVMTLAATASASLVNPAAAQQQPLQAQTGQVRGAQPQAGQTQAGSPQAGQARPIQAQVTQGTAGQAQFGAGQVLIAQQVPLDANQTAQLRAAQQQALQNSAQQAQNAASPGQPAASQPAASQQAAAVQQAAQMNPANGAVNPVAPFPPLNEQWQAYLDKVLTAWEAKGATVQRYECKFKRFQYDPTLVTPDAYTVAEGTLKYMQPDKGLFKVEQLVYYKGREQDGKSLKYEPNPQKPFGEYWICDGKFVHVLDQNEKKCIKYELPPQMRGQGIHLSPLPFVFGVKAADLKTRYWITPMQVPADRKNEVWLEVYPRRADDAANYKKLHVVLDTKDWMPKYLIVFLPNYRPEMQHRELYEFADREINANRLLGQLFMKAFIPEDPPKDWTVIIEPHQEAAPAAEPRVATPPAAGPAVR